MQLQVLEVAVGLVAAFFLVSLVASAFVEVLSKAFSKRAKDLDSVLSQMLKDGDTRSIDLRNTSVYKAIQSATNRTRPLGRDTSKAKPSYMSARSFADGVIEGLLNMKTAHQNLSEVVNSLPLDQPIRQRLVALQAEFGDDLTAIKAGLEGWFDDTMDRLEGAYKRWSQWILLAIGLIVAVGLNVSATRIVDSLWNDQTLRTAVADSAADISNNPCPAEEGEDPPAKCPAEDKIEEAISNLEELDLPIGWSQGVAAEPWWGWVGMIFTGAAVMLGAQFWFDLLTRLTSARGTGGVPPKAAEDTGSATRDAIAMRTRTAARFSELHYPVHPPTD